MDLLSSFMTKEKENRQFEEKLPQELDNYLSRFLLSVRKKNGDEYEPPTLGRIQNMDPRSMDNPCGPGPWTTSLDPVHGPLHGPPLFLRDNAQGRR